MSPPLREKADVKAIIESIKDGTIDVIVTDHAPHSENEKVDISSCPNGIIGFETALKLGITYLVDPGHITLTRLIELMSFNPSKLLGLDRGEIKVGAIADITIFNKDIESVYTKESIVSKSKNSPYIGLKLKGQVTNTIVNGNLVYSRTKAGTS